MGRFALATRTSQQLTNDEVNDTPFSWSDDGSAVLTTSHRGGDGSRLSISVWRIHAQTGAMQQEDIGPEVDYALRSPNGAWIGSVGACLVGGEEPAGTLAPVECVSQGGEVTELPSLEVPRHGLGVAVLDDAVYAILGGDAPGLFVTAVTERLPLD